MEGEEVAGDWEAMDPGDSFWESTQALDDHHNRNAHRALVEAGKEKFVMVGL